MSLNPGQCVWIRRKFTDLKESKVLNRTKQNCCDFVCSENNALEIHDNHCALVADMEARIDSKSQKYISNPTVEEYVKEKAQVS